MAPSPTLQPTAIFGPVFICSEDEDEGNDADGSTVPPSFNSDTGSATKPKARLGTNLEPICYQSLPMDFYLDTFETYCVKGVFDLAMGDATVA